MNRHHRSASPSTGPNMGYMDRNKRNPYEDHPLDRLECPLTLMKDLKTICPTRCLYPPFILPSVCSISEICRAKPDDLDTRFPPALLFPNAPKDSHEEREWLRFMSYLKSNGKVAYAKIGTCELYISPPSKDMDFGQALMLYKLGKHEEENGGTGAHAALPEATKAVDASVASHLELEVIDKVDKFTDRVNTCMGNTTPNFTDDKCSDEKTEEAREANANDLRQSLLEQSNLMKTHPSYLRTLGETHSGWIFGAIAELVFNSRDANAKKLEISIDLFSRTTGEDIPVLSVIDNGHGMTHQDILRMVSFGHDQLDVVDQRHIGRYGIGFKSGAMTLGKDVLVLTQTATSSSIAFLSQTFNEGKDSLVVPIISYQRRGSFVEVDTRVMTKESARSNLQIIEEFSPFNEYLIGQKAGLFCETGTQIYIWNLGRWDSDYCLEWQNRKHGFRTFQEGDILLRSRQIRTRPGQTNQIVPLDYSLQSYLEVIFFKPQMKIYVQGSQVRCRSLEKSLSDTVVENGRINGKAIQLTIGCSWMEWQQANGGIFLYWHGRLIEAFKRVGGMVHNTDTGRGVIGVVEVADIMEDANGQSLVLNNKQGFLHSELYVQLEDWLGKKFDQYRATYFDNWVRCDKCMKWRKLRPDFDRTKLSDQEWFCYMDPFFGNCEIPEDKYEDEVITLSSESSGRSDGDSDYEEDWPTSTRLRSDGNSEPVDYQPICKRLRSSSSKKDRQT